MSSPLHQLIAGYIREDGPITVAAFIELALYHPQYGYYSAAAQRSGRCGDFITSIDTGLLFGEMVAVQLEELWRQLDRPAAFDVVDAGAGNGRLMRDVLDAAETWGSELYGALRVWLVERSDMARAAHRDVLGPHYARLVRTGPALPSGIEGVIVANELLDAMPVHLAVMTPTGLREIYVGVAGDRLCEMEGDLSTPLIADYVRRTGAAPRPGERLAVGLEAAAWIRSAARSLRRGFLMLFDYAADARQLHASGTLSASQAHVCTDWLMAPGERDITSHLDLASIEDEARIAGLAPLGATDLTYFLMGLGITQHLSGSEDRLSAARRGAAKSLLLPEGLGGTQKVLVFAKGVDDPALSGLSQRRLT